MLLNRMGKLSSRMWKYYWGEYKLNARLLYTSPKIFYLIFIMGLVITILVFYDLYQTRITGDVPYIGISALVIGIPSAILIAYLAIMKKR